MPKTVCLEECGQELKAFSSHFKKPQFYLRNFRNDAKEVFKKLRKAARLTICPPIDVAAIPIDEKNDGCESKKTLETKTLEKSQTHKVWKDISEGIFWLYSLF